MQLVFDWGWMPQLASGLLVTVELTLGAIAVGAACGLLLAIGRVYGPRGVSLLCNAYTQTFRGTPLLVQVMLIYFGLPSAGLYLSPFLSGLIALSMNSSAFQAEYFRGAILSVAEGQVHAALAIGMTRWQAVYRVVIPQAIRLVLPPWSNEVVYMLKGSSVVYLVSLADLLGVGRTIASKTFRYFEILAVVALIYLMLVLVITLVMRWAERKIRVPGLTTTSFRG